MYRFRICASNEAGQGPFSQVYSLVTAFAHPPPVKSTLSACLLDHNHCLILYVVSLIDLFPDPPRASGITSDGCLAEWNSVKLAQNQPGEIHYKVQMTKNVTNESKTVSYYHQTSMESAVLSSLT